MSHDPFAHDPFTEHVAVFPPTAGDSGVPIGVERRFAEPVDAPPSPDRPDPFFWERP